METHLEYITHDLILTEVGSFTKVSVFVKNPITYDWFDIILNSKYALRYVEGERLLIRNFLKSLMGLPTLNAFDIDSNIDISVFEDYSRHYIYCVNNDLPYEEHEWFKTAYIKANIFVSTSICINKSIQLVGRLYPETIHFPDNSIDKIYEIVKGNNVFRHEYYLIEKILRDNHIDRLYHSTATENIPSIKQCHGLLSLERLKKQNIEIKFASSEKSRSIDAYKGIADYVHLSFESYYPMMKKAVLDGRLCDYTMLIVSPVAALLQDTMFTDKNIVTTGAIPSGDISVLQRIPFSNFHNKRYWDLSEEDKKSYMAEVLVKGFVPSSSILNWDTL